MKRNISSLVFGVVVALTVVSVVSPGASLATTRYNDRYYADASGFPKFLMGFYSFGWVTSYSIDEMIDYAEKYNLNYIRIGIGLDTENGIQTDQFGFKHSAFYKFDEKYNLNQFNEYFYDRILGQIRRAADRGISVHLTFFDGPRLVGSYLTSESRIVVLPSGEQIQIPRIDNFWNPSTHSLQPGGFYPDPDASQNGGNGDGNIESRKDSLGNNIPGEFYKVDKFLANTGIGFYQRKLIDKAIAEFGNEPNVFFEIGNELFSAPEQPGEWLEEVRAYIKARTSKLLTINPWHQSTYSNFDGVTKHNPLNNPADGKALAQLNVGKGYPFIVDPDSLFAPDPQYTIDPMPSATPPHATLLKSFVFRQQAWYALTGGAAGYGGFSAALWGRNPEDGTQDWGKTLPYYRNLQLFIRSTGIPFWDMVPNQCTISNPANNSCLANTTRRYYLGYVMADSTVNITLGSGNYYSRTYDPVTGVLSGETAFNLTSTTARSFTKPAGAGDWAVYVYPSAVESGNVARGKAVASSSSDENQQWGVVKVVNGTRNSMDGNRGYTSNSDLGNQNHAEWITVDLGTSMLVSRVDLYPRTDNNGMNFPENFTIKTSADNVTWTTAITQNGFLQPTDGLVRSFSFDDRNARYVKVEGTRLRPNEFGQYRMAFAEVEVQARSKSVTALSSLEHIDWSKAKAVNGARNSVVGNKGYISNSNLTTESHSEWVTVDLGASVNVSRVDLYPRTDPGFVGSSFPVDFVIETSGDNSSWSAAVQHVNYQKPTDGAVRSFSFSSRNARYIRVRGTKHRPDGDPLNQYRMGFAEIEVR